MCKMFVKLPKNVFNVGCYAEGLGFRKIPLGLEEGATNLSSFKGPLMKLVSASVLNYEKSTPFVGMFLVHLSRGSLQTLGIITSEKELSEILAFEDLIGKIPTLYLATKDQLKGVSSPVSIDDFLSQRRSHEKAVAEKTCLQNNVVLSTNKPFQQKEVCA